MAREKIPNSLNIVFIEAPVIGEPRGAWQSTPSNAKTKSRCSVHYTSDGSAALAGEVEKAIAAALAK
jgi:hypothetical protein